MSENQQPVLMNIENGIATITLNRPEKLNSFNVEQHKLLKKHFEQCRDDNNVRSIILTGAGRGFCAGQDLEDRHPKMGQEYDLGATLKEYYNPLILLMRDIPKPIICAINGVAAGAGVSLVLACDIAIATNKTKFVQAFSKIGLVPDSGSTWLMTRIIGEQRAKYLTFTGDALSAEKAESYGLISKVVEEQDLMSNAMELAVQFADGPSLSYKLIKDAIQQSHENTLNQQLELEQNYQRTAGVSDDYKEGVIAFMEKRKPNFKK